MLNNHKGLSYKQSKGTHSSISQQVLNFNQEASNYINEAQVNASGDEFSQCPSSNKQQQQQLNRNNTLYKFLNQYFTGNDSQKANQKVQRLPHIPSQENLLQNDMPSGDSSSGIFPISETDSQFNATTRSSLNKQSNASLRNKLAETMKALPTAQRIKQMSEKTKKKTERKIWTAQKDHLLRLLVNKFGQDWETIASEMQDPQIDSQSVRERYATTLRSEDRKAKFSLQEDQTIAKYHKVYGANWKLIAKHLPGRTEAMVRKRFHSSIKRKLNLGGEIEITGDLNKPDVEMENSQATLKDVTTENVESQLLQKEVHQEVFNKSNGLDEFRFDNANPFADFEPFDSHFFSKDNLGLESKNHDFNSEMLLPEFDLLAGRTAYDVAEMKNDQMEIDCSSPIIDSALPAEWGNHHHFEFSDEKFEKENQFFEMNLDEPIKQTERKSDLEEESYWNNLIDFNQEPIVDKNLTLEQNSICSKEDKQEVSQSKPLFEKSTDNEEADKSEFMKTELNKTMSAFLTLDTDQESSSKIHHLMSQIKSIEMLFNLTRKEIHRLQSDFAK